MPQGFHHRVGFRLQGLLHEGRVDGRTVGGDFPFELETHQNGAQQLGIIAFANGFLMNLPDLLEGRLRMVGSYGGFRFFP